MCLRCIMGVAFYLILCSCGFHAILSAGALPPGSRGFTLARNGTLTVTNRTTKETEETTKLIQWNDTQPPLPEKGDWRCPHVTDVAEISCTCDIPHTVRCRGHALRPEAILDLTKELKSTKDPAAKVSLLDLAIHGIGQLPPISFDGLPLLGLVISKAGLSTLSRDSFKGLEANLAALGLPANEIKAIPAQSLKILRKLQRLDLSDNSLESLKSHEFPTLLQLQNLNLAGNGLAVIEPEAFVRLPQLKTLILARNQLDASQINEKTLWGLHFLSNLSLQFNLLKGSLASNFLLGAPKLVSLDLSHNAITKITLGTLEGCKNLRALDLSNNKIDIIEDHAFRNLSSLENLRLSHNQIISVSGWSLAHLPKLVSLDLADNALFAVTADLLHQLPSLASVDLAANDISLLQPNVFNYTPSLSALNLSDNPLHCDCSLTWLWTWLKAHPFLKEKDQKSVVCTTPPTLENAPLIDLNITDLTCSKEVPDYYHDEAYYEELYDFHLSDAEVSLQEASWVDDVVQLVWRVDKRAVPYTCHAVHIYEIEDVEGSTHQILAEKMEVNCSSEGQVNPHQVVVTVPGALLRPGGVYRYCLVLLEHGTDDEERFLPGCSEALPLKESPVSTATQTEGSWGPRETKVTSLTAGNMGMSLVVQTRVSSSRVPCFYSVYVVQGRTIAASSQLNCSEARQAFPSLVPGEYMVCVQPEDIPGVETLEYLQKNLASSPNVTAMLLLLFPACTTVQLQEESRSSWHSGSLLTLLFTIPGLALIITLYVIGRRIWKGGGVPWRWDPRATKRAKYFLYTGETTTPTVSLDPLPLPIPESSV